MYILCKCYIGCVQNELYETVLNEFDTETNNISDDINKGERGIYTCT